MAGQKLVLKTAFTDKTLEILRDDPMLVPGALFLFDATHELNPMPAGIPGTGSTVPNLAEAQARAMVGGSEPLAGVLHYSGVTTAGSAVGRIERTTKGGIHTILSQVGALGNAQGSAIEMPAAVRAWILANPSHSWYFSVSDRITRVSKAATLRTADLSGGNTQTSANLMSINGTTSQAPGRLGGRALGSGFNAIGPSMKNIAGTNPAITALNPGTLSARFGNAGGFNYNQAVNGTAPNSTSHPSGAIYRMSFEDLTVSGRTFAQADAADAAVWNRLFGAGGRYADDTFTAPSTIA